MSDPKPYSIGRHLVSIFGGYDIWEILDTQGKEICRVTGPKEDAERLVAHLNLELGLTDEDPES